MSYVGLYFVVNHRLLYEYIAVEDAEKYGNFKVYNGSHYDIWRTKYEKTFKSSYDYYPRGRVVYNFIENRFTIYADKCISEKMLSEIIKQFQLSDANTTIDRTDFHYVCHKCSLNYVAD